MIKAGNRSGLPRKRMLIGCPGPNKPSLKPYVQGTLNRLSGLHVEEHLCMQKFILYIHIHAILINEFKGEWGGIYERVCRENWEKKNVVSFSKLKADVRQVL